MGTRTLSFVSKEKMGSNNNTYLKINNIIPIAYNSVFDETFSQKVSNNMISIVYNVEKYRKLLNKQVKKGDVVIEIGPHSGKSTLSYVSKTKLTVVGDIAIQSKIAFKNILKEHKNLIFIEGDARSFDTIKKVIKITKNCDFLAIDLGGGRYPDTVFKVWAVWSGIFKPKNSLIRNRGLGEFIKRAIIKDDYFNREFPDSGWLSEWGRGIPSNLKEQLGEFKFWIDIKKPLE